MIKRMVIAAALTACSALGVFASDNISGAWHGTLKIAPQVELKIVFHFMAGDDGAPAVTLDSPDQGAYGIPGEVVFISPDSVNVTVRSIGLAYAGQKYGDKLIGRCSQGAMSINLELSPGAVELVRPQTPRPPYPYATKEVRFVNPAANVTLAGTLTLPEGYTDETPAIVMVTGSGLQNRNEEIFGHKPFAVIADYLAHNGIASLRYDDRGCGNSSGDGRSATTEDFAGDAKCGVEYMRKIERFKSVGILGHSEGASVAFILGAKDSPLYVAPDFITALGAQSVRGDSILIDQSVTMLEQGNIPQQIIKDYTEALRKLYDFKISEGNVDVSRRIEDIFADRPAIPVYTSLKANLMEIASETNPWLGYFIGFSPAKYISATDCPTFVLYGERDLQVRPALNMPSMRRLAADARVKLYPGLNHLLQHAPTGAVSEYGTIEETISPEVLRDIAAFILEIK